MKELTINMLRMQIGERKITYFILAVFLFTIMSSGGCSSIVAKKYAEPLSGKTAKLRISNTAPGKIAVNIYERADTCSERRVLNTTADWISIPAEKDLSFTIFLDVETYNRRMEVIGLLGGALGTMAAVSSSADGTNQVTIKFSPKPDFYYSAEITSDTKKYAVNFVSSQLKEGPYIAETTAKLMRFHRAVSEAGSWCESSESK